MDNEMCFAKLHFNDSASRRRWRCATYWLKIQAVKWKPQDDAFQLQESSMKILQNQSRKIIQTAIAIFRQYYYQICYNHALFLPAIPTIKI